VLATAFPLPDENLASNGAHIRRATMGDLDALVELENAAFAVERMSTRQLRRHLESLSAEVLVATRERRVIGAAVLFFRRGIGDALLHAAEQSTRRHGRRVLRLEVRSENRGAQRLYERHGYRHFGKHAAYYEDGHDAERYEKALA
jgi:ribosomal-protein-alanine N-acetyltransferase